jgi:hypothetical protein
MGNSVPFGRFATELLSRFSSQKRPCRIPNPNRYGIQQRTAQFTRALSNMKTLAEGGKLPAPAAR